MLLCCNADGSEKLKPLVIGKSEKPQCFKNVKTFPTKYLANKKAWVTGKIFTDWLQGVDKQMASQNRHILMFIDGCSAHPKDVLLTNTEVHFLPANSTSKLQPLDLGIIRTVKVHYRSRLLKRTLQYLRLRRLDDMKIDVLQVINNFFP